MLTLPCLELNKVSSVLAYANLSVMQSKSVAIVLKINLLEALSRDIQKRKFEQPKPSLLLLKLVQLSG